MKVHPLLALLILITPAIASADISLEGLKEGAAKAAKAVGDTTKGAVDAAGEVAGKATGAVKETVDSTKEGLSDEATPEATRAKLDAMAEQTLRRLFARSPEAAPCSIAAPVTRCSTSGRRASTLSRAMGAASRSIPGQARAST